jgi:hypothetical protein
MASPNPPGHKQDPSSAKPDASATIPKSLGCSILDVTTKTPKEVIMGMSVLTPAQIVARTALPDCDPLIWRSLIMGITRKDRFG